MSEPNGPLPIAFCITELDRGGAERALTQLVLGLDRTAWLPRVYCLGPRGHFADILESNGVIVECFGATGAFSLPRVLFRLTRALQVLQPALLQTFLFHGNLVGRFAGHWAGVPRIVSGIRVAEHRSRWHGRLDRWTSGLVDHNVCVSQGVADFSTRVTRLSPEKLSVIPNGVDLEFIEKSPAVDVTSLGIPAVCPVILTVGRLEEQKGLIYLLQAATDVLKLRSDCHFVIVGEGPDRASLESLAAKLGISPSVHFLGGRSDVPGLLKAATLFVLPSLWEGMSNSLLEAMAARLPVIATAVEGSSELIQSGVNGLLVQPRDSSALATAILSLINDPATASRLSKASQETIAERFTSSVVVATYEQLYRKLIARD